MWISISIDGVSQWEPRLIKSPLGSYWQLEAGEDGRGRLLYVIPLAVGEFPPDRDHQAPTPVTLLSVHDGFYIINSKGDKTYRALVRLQQAPGFRGSAKWSAEGDIDFIAAGYEAQGDAGRMGGAEVPVFGVRDGGNAIIRWTRTGRLYGTPSQWRCAVMPDGDGVRCVVAPDTPQYDLAVAALSH